MREFKSCICQAVREVQTQREQSRLKLKPAHKARYRTGSASGGWGAGESRMETKQHVFCFLFITAFVGVVILDHCLQWKSCVCFCQEFLSAFFLGKGGTYLHPSNPFPLCLYFTLWDNLKALLSLPLVSWLEVSSGNITETVLHHKDKASAQLGFAPRRPAQSSPRLFIPQSGWALCHGEVP